MKTDTHNYQLYTLVGKEKMVLDIFNRGRFSYMPHLASMADFSGQNWSIEKVGKENSFRLSTTFFGITMWLDVINGGIFDGLLLVVPQDKYSGRLWEINENENGFKLSTVVDGATKCIDLQQGGDFNNMPYLTDENHFSGQLWKMDKSVERVLKYAI